MAGKPVVLVAGASGNIGAATVSVLAEKYADKVEIRAGARNPDKIPARPNVTVVKAVMGDKDQLKEPLKGVDVLYIVTPGAEDRAPLTIRTAEAAKEAGVKFILVVSAPTVILPDTVFGKQLSEIEDKVSKLGIPYSFLRLPIFIDNIWGSKDTIVSQSAFYAPQSPDKPAIYIAVEDAAKAGAAILTDYSKHNGKGYTIQSDRYTNAEFAAAFTEALGKEVKFIQVPPEAAKQAMVGKGWPEWQVDGFFELLKVIEEGAPVLTAGDDGQALKSLTGEEPTSMKAWVTKNAPGFK
uniref:NmrA-like family domain-containing protein 1 n=1 Tax=Amphimedon queenslandica TaxID=400682 RepID=A0A1X7U149_AMPQE